MLKIRTIYVKARNIETLRTFYMQLFAVVPKPKKDSAEWVEFDFGNINFALLPLHDEPWLGSNCVPVFQRQTHEIAGLRDRVLALGGAVIEEYNEDFISLVCRDPDGNEFEISNHDD